MNLHARALLCVLLGRVSTAKLSNLSCDQGFLETHPEPRDLPGTEPPATRCVLTTMCSPVAWGSENTPGAAPAWGPVTRLLAADVAGGCVKELPQMGVMGIKHSARPPGEEAGQEASARAGARVASPTLMP